MNETDLRKLLSNINSYMLNKKRHSIVKSYHEMFPYHVLNYMNVPFFYGDFKGLLNVSTNMGFYLHLAQT